MIAFLFCLILLFLAILLDFLLLFRSKSPDPRTNRILTNIGDLVLLVLLACLAIFLYVGISNRMDQISGILDKISDIRWGDKDLAFKTKVSDYFASTKELFDFVTEMRTMDQLSMLLLLVLLFRTVTCTSEHPRVALVTSTIQAGLDDLKHFGIVFLIIYVCFALLATWTFGAAREEFGTIESSLLAQLDLMLGGLPDGWAEESWQMILYVICNLIVIFFLLLNFLLSIIVDAYMVYKEKVKEDQFEMAFFTDLLLTAWAWCQSKRWKWPSYVQWAHWLDSLPEDSTITLNELAQFINSPSKQAVLAFDQIYFNRAKGTEAEAKVDEPRQLPDSAKDVTTI